MKETYTNRTKTIKIESDNKMNTQEYIKELQDVVTQLWNAIYQDKQLGEVYNSWCESGAHPVTIEMITRQLPPQMRQALIKGYDVLHREL